MTLFGSTPKQAPPTPLSPLPKPRAPTSYFEKLKDPQGKADKRGKYAYQKMHETVSKLPQDMQDLFHQMINLNYTVKFLPLLETLNSFNKLHLFDSEDYRRATGNWV
jgi:hypothetical protein